MSTLYALLWKEGREILPKVLVGVALAVVVCLMRNNVDFNRSYAEGFDVLIMGGLVVMAIVLAMDAIARERSTGTLSFLLDKPMASATVLAVKFLLGLGGLLLVALVAWATVYIDLASLEVERAWLAYRLVAVQSIDYASMVALSFTQFSLLYALIFIGSVVTDHPFKGAAVGIALTVILGVFLTGPAMAIFPILNRYPLVAIGLDDQGHLVRLATDAARFWVKVLANMVLTATALAVAVVLLRRYREAMLSWRTVAIGWGAIIVAVFAIFYGGPLLNQRMPAGVLAAPDKQYYGDLAVQGELAYMTIGQSGIAIADLSNPQQMRLLGSARPESYKLWESRNDICVIDSLAYIVGWRKGLPCDSLGVVVFDVSDPATPTLKGYRMFAATKKDEWSHGGYRYWGATDDGLLLVREQGGDLIVVEAFSLDAEGMPVAGDVQMITTIDPMGGPDLCHVSVRGSRAYIGTGRELVVIDVADAHALRETGRHTIESFRPESYYRAKLVATDGDKLYVERFWPHELVEFDIANPDQLREVGYLPLSGKDDILSLQVVDGMAYSRAWWSSDVKMKAWTVAKYGALIEGFSLVGPEDLESDLWGFNALSVAHGYLYATRHEALVAYRLD